MINVKRKKFLNIFDKVTPVYTVLIKNFSY